MTKIYQLSHCTYCCQYHVVWTPRYRGKILNTIFIKQELKREFKSIAKWKGFNILQWHIGDEHIHLYITIPPKYSVSYIICILKSKTSTWIKKKTKKFPRGALWARGYFVSTIGINEFAITKYIQNQQYRQVDLKQQKLF